MLDGWQMPDTQKPKPILKSQNKRSEGDATSQSPKTVPRSLSQSKGKIIKLSICGLQEGTFFEYPDTKKVQTSSLSARMLK